MDATAWSLPMISLVNGHREILRMAEQACRDVWRAKFSEPPPEGALRQEGVAEPQTFKGDYFTRASIVTPEETQGRAGVGLIDDSTAVRYRYRGLLFVQVFGTKSKPGSYFAVKDFVEALKMKFIERRDATTGIAFLNVRMKDNLPKEAQWYQAQMVAEWEFDEVLTVAS